MKSALQILERWKSSLRGLQSKISASLLGTNNERVDFIIDSFHKLSPQQKKLFLGGGGSVLAAFFGLVFFLYFAQVSALQKRLEEGMKATQKLQQLSGELTQQEQLYRQLVRDISAQTRSLNNLKSHFERLSRNEGISLRELKEKSAPLPDSNVLSESFTQTNVMVLIDNISLPKLLKYITQIEKSGRNLSIHGLKIRSRYETKLYFDSEISVKGYSKK